MSLLYLLYLSNQILVNKERIMVAKKGQDKKVAGKTETPKANAETKKVEPKPKERIPRDFSTSNKAQVYLAWRDGEVDTSALHKKVSEEVKLSTIKSWTGMWKKGKGLPAIAKTSER
jgi:hypothetical protein